MGVIVRIGKQKAILRGAEWRCAVASLEADLNRFTRNWVQRDALDTELAGNLEEAISKAVVHQFDGKVILRAIPRADVTQKRYFRLRQLSLF